MPGPDDVRAAVFNAGFLDPRDENVEQDAVSLILWTRPTVGDLRDAAVDLTAQTARTLEDNFADQVEGDSSKLFWTEVGLSEQDRLERDLRRIRSAEEVLARFESRRIDPNSLQIWPAPPR